MKIALLFTIPALLALSSYGQQKVTGVVFEDKNGNGKKERHEKGLPGVGVSNGVQVVQTDSRGYYTLPVSQDQIIFAIKPAGYAFPLKETNLPDFYYIHKPGGSPANFKYRGVAPTGPLPESVDFALHPVQEPDSFKVLVFGDPQPYNMEQMNYFEQAIISEVAKGQGYAFGISLGDLVGDTLDLHIPYMEKIKQLGTLWYNVMGNHDMNYEATADSLSDETFEKHFGPANYSFNYGDAHFLILDDILYPHPLTGKGYWAGFREAQFEFIKNDLALTDKSKLIVLAFHIPLKEGENTYRAADRERLFELLKDFPNVLALSAHTHFQKHTFFGEADGWKGKTPFHEYNVGTTSGDWYSGELNEAGVPISTMRDGTPKGYAFLNVSGNRYTLDYKVAGSPSGRQIDLFHPRVVARNQRTSAAIYANFFMGSDHDVVECRVDGGDWKPMKRMNMFDPGYLSLVNRWDVTDTLMPGRRPSNPVTSSHVWTMGIPTQLAAGEHSIEVRATDMFGRIFRAESRYRVQEPVKPM